MRKLKGILIWPLLMVMRLFRLGEGYQAPSREEVKRQLIEHLAEQQAYEHPADFWKHQ